MAEKKAARGSGNYSRAKKASAADADIVPRKWTEAECRMFAALFGGWWIAMAVLEVIFKW